MTSEDAVGDPVAFINQCVLNPNSILNPASADTLALIDGEKQRLLELIERLELARQNIEGRL